MLTPRWRKVLNDLALNKTRTVLVILSLSVGIFAVGVIVHAQIVLTRNVAERYAAYHPASAILATTEPFDDELISAVGRMKEVGQAEGRYTILARIRRADSGDWYQLALCALDDYADIRINQILPDRGDYPPPPRALVLERSALDFIGAQIGENVQIEMPSGVKRVLRIVGAVRDPNAIPPIYSAPVVAYASFETLEWLGEERGFNRLLITVADSPRDRTHIEQVAARVREAKMETATRRVAQVDIPVSPGDPPLSFVLNAMLLVLGALSVMVLLPSGFLVVNTIQALLMQQVRQIGVMKALGGRRHQIVAMYLAFVTVLGVLALALPLPLAAGGAQAFSRYMAEILNLDISGFSTPMQAVALEVAVGLIVPLAAALVPVLGGTRVTVREAIAQYGIGDSRLEIKQPNSQSQMSSLRFVPRPLLLSLRNAFRRKGRLAFTLIPLTLSGALFIAVFSVRASLLLSLDELAQFWKYDIAMDLQAPYPVERLEAEARTVPGVVGMEFWGIGTGSRVRADGSESIALPIVAPAADTRFIQPILVQGRWLLPEDENAIVLSTTVFNYEPQIQVGDEIVLKILNRETAWRVVGFVQGGMTTIPYVYVNYAEFARVIRSTGRANGLRIATAQHDSAFQLQTMKAIEEHFKQTGLRVRMTEASAELIERITSGMMVLIMFLLVLALLLAAVGGLGLMGTMSLNVLERTREIGVMRAIGAGTGSILVMVMVESILIGIISALLGAVLAYPISAVLSYETGQLLFQTPLAFAFAVDGIGAWLVVVVVIAAVASFLPARNATRLTVREVLAYE